MRTTIIKRAHILLLAAIFMLLTACDLDDLFKSQFTIEGVSEGAVYVGLNSDTDRPAAAQGMPRMPHTITFHFDSIKDQVPATLNGQYIGDLLSYGPNSATVSVDDKLANFLRQGKNVLAVDAMNFGPKVNFIFDNKGPLVEVTRVEEVGSVLNLTVRADDSATASSVFIERYNYNFKQQISATGQVTSFIPISGQNNAWKTVSSVQPAELYKITATDAYGYVSENYFLNPEAKINNVFRMRIDKKILDYAVPLLPAQIKGMYMYSEMLLNYYGENNPTLLFPEDDPTLVVNQPIPKGTTADQIKDPRNPKPSAIFDELAKFWKKDAIFYGDMGSRGNQNACGWIQTESLRVEPGTNAYKEGPWQDGSNNWHFPAGWVQGVDYKTGECTRIRMGFIQLNNITDMTFTLHPSRAGYLSLDMTMGTGYVPGNNALKLDLGMQHIKCGNGRKDQYCWDNGNPTAVLVANLSRNTVTATSGNPKGPIGVNIHDGNLNLGISSSDVSLNLSGLGMSGSIGGFIGSILGILGGVLDSMFVDIAGSVIAQNMPQFIIGFDLFSEWDTEIIGGIEESGPSLKMQSHAYQVTTNAGSQPPGTDPQWFMDYAGFLTPYLERVKKKKVAGKLVINNNDPDAVRMVLGSRFTDEPVLAPSGSEDFHAAFNMNIMNQALTAFYLSGITHLTAANIHSDGGKLKLYNGPHRTDENEAKKGDTRVELIPRTPPIFELDQTDKTLANLLYRNARMKIQTYTGDWATDGVDGWEIKFDVEADMKIAAIMHIEDQVFKITVLGTPELILNNVKTDSDTLFGILLVNGLNDTDSLANRVLKGALQFGVDTVLNFIVPELSKQFGEVKFPGIYIPAIGDGLYVTSEGIHANNREHLDFSMNFAKKPCTVSTENNDKLVESHGKAIVLCEPDD